jgi:uncharacterized LabA/DUF88 family protein
MFKAKENNFSFVDSNNLNLGMKDLDWKLDYKKFRIYLKEKYNIAKAYLFLGYIPGNEVMYTSLQEAGFLIIFKPIILNKDGNCKGNVDAELVLHTMIEYPNFDQAVIVSSDGDFYCLVKYLYENNKLKKVISPYIGHCSVLLRRSAKEKIIFMDNLQEKLEYKRKSTA